MSTAHLRTVTYPYTGSLEKFHEDAATHQLAIVLDTDTHKHLQFRHPGTSCYWFDLLAWPGTLVIRGDMGTFVLSRERDMFAWIEASRGAINPGYWAEKLVAGRDNLREAYPDPGALREWVSDVARDAYDYYDAERQSEMCHAVDEAFNVIEWGDTEGLRDIEAGGCRPFEDFDPADHLNFSWQWIWCCHAIVWGIAQYREVGR